MLNVIKYIFIYDALLPIFSRTLANHNVDGSELSPMKKVGRTFFLDTFQSTVILSSYLHTITAAWKYIISVLSQHPEIFF